MCIAHPQHTICNCSKHRCRCNGLLYSLYPSVFPFLPWQVKDVTRNIKKAVCAGSLEEIRAKVAEKFEKCDHQPTIHLDSDGTEIDDEEYFRTLDENTELVAVFPGEHWVDVSTHNVLAPCNLISSTHGTTSTLYEYILVHIFYLIIP